MTDFTHIIFELDDTLYSRQTGLLREINRRIVLWLQINLSLSPDEANALRHSYFTRHGTTLGGLLAARKVQDPTAYLAFVHDIPVEQYVAPDPALTAMLDDIPLRRVVFTNSSSEYARRVLQAMGLTDKFEQVIGIQEVELHSKPHPRSYELLLAMLGVRGENCIMVEDRAANLEPAKRLGMVTVLVDGAPAEGVDLVVDSVLQVGAVLQHLWPAQE